MHQELVVGSEVLCPMGQQTTILLECRYLKEIKFLYKYERIFILKYTCVKSCYNIGSTFQGKTQLRGRISSKTPLRAYRLIPLLQIIDGGTQFSNINNALHRYISTTRRENFREYVDDIIAFMSPDNMIRILMKKTCLQTA